MSKVIEQQIMGTFGECWFDGNKLMEVESVSSTIAINREDVSQAGTLSMGSRITSLKGEGTLKIKKVDSRVITDITEKLLNGEDPKVTLIFKLKSPQDKLEVCVLSDVWFTSANFFSFELQQLLTTEIPFEFSADKEHVEFTDKITL